MTVRDAVPEDAETVELLLRDLDRFYGEASAEPRAERVRQIRRILTEPALGVHVLLAHVNGAPVGLASYSYVWPASGVTVSLFLKELWVNESYRRQGVATSLMRHLAEIADADGCSRIDWTTETTNRGAEGLYAALGAEIATDKVFYRWRRSEPM